MNARGFASEAEARQFGNGLKTALEVSAVAARVGVDTGRNLATSALGKIVKDALAQEGAHVRDNIHGLDVFPDHPHARANRQKPRGIAAKETILTIHLVPLLGSKRLDAITTEEVQRLTHRLRDRAPKTVNNVLTVLNMLLKKAVEWNVIERMPCAVKLLPVPKPSMGFYGAEEYEQLVDAARATDPNALVIVLLGGEAGLRCGEMMALEWRDVDLGKRQICVQRSECKGHVTAPKGGRLRSVRMTVRLATALPRTSTLAVGSRLTSGQRTALRGCREAFAPESGGARGGDSSAGVFRRTPESWRHFGDSGG